MRLSLLSIIPLISSAAAFAPMSSRAPFTALNAVTEAAISGNNIDLTPALTDYVNSKLDKVMGKLASSGVVQDTDVHLTVNKNPKVKEGHKAEIVTSVKGTVIRCAEESPDMYASIDIVTDRLARKLLQYKERRLEGFHGGPNMGENLAEVLNSLEDLNGVSEATETEEFVDPETPSVTKVKSYDLSTPISIEEAIFALDYVDHDFYVFRDADTKEINVVYKRNAGGFGLIQPE